MRGPTREQRAASRRAPGTAPVRYQRLTPDGPPSLPGRRAVRLYALPERGVARPAGFEPAASWFVVKCPFAISLVLQCFSLGTTTMLQGIRRKIVH